MRTLFLIASASIAIMACQQRKNQEEPPEVPAAEIDFPADERASMTQQNEGLVGEKFVDFEVEYEGKTQRLSDYVGRGKYVLVDFWASWCGPCRQEVPNLIAIYNDFEDKGLEVVGVATADDPADSKRAMEELGIKYPQILNAQGIGAEAYGVEGIPEIMLFAPDGTILRQHLRGQEVRKAVEEVLNK